MTIDEKATTTYKATSLPNAPTRDTRAEAEADEARGVELAAYLAVLPTLTREQWERVTSQGSSHVASQYAAWYAAWDAAAAAAVVAGRNAARVAAWDVAWDAAWVAARDAAVDAARDAAWVAVAIVVRDFITADQFDILTAPMSAAEIDFDALTTGSEDRES